LFLIYFCCEYYGWNSCYQFCLALLIWDLYWFWFLLGGWSTRLCSTDPV
jgi:hypothetical protein